MGHIQVNVGVANREVEGDCVSEFGVRCTEVGDAGHGVTNRGVALAGTGQWMVQGRGGTNPLTEEIKPKKTPQKKIECATKIAGEELPAWVNNLKKKVIATSPKKKSRQVKNVVVGEKPVLTEMATDRFTLDWWKCYLDSCATYHTFFVKEFLSKVHTGTATMKGSCNAGTVSTNTRGWYGEFKVWLNTKGIANLLSIPM